MRWPVLKVYEFKGFANPARVRIALAEKGLFDKTEFVQINLPAGEHRSPEYRAKNPSGLVPALELEDGTILSECSAITEYLDGLSGETDLTGRTAIERARINMMQRKIEQGFLGAATDFFHHATEGLGPDVELYQNADWGRHQLDVAMKTLEWMNGVLEGQNYFAGDTFTIADITAMAGCALLDFLKLEIPAEYKNMKAWHARVFARPSAALAA